MEPVGIPFHGPGIQMTDLSLFKQVKFTERLQLQFRAEFFNAFNIPTSRTPVPVFLARVVWKGGLQHDCPHSGH